MAKSPIRVLVVDDYDPWHVFVSITLQPQPGILIIGHVTDGWAAVQQAQQLQPDLILLDIGLPGLNGIEAARRIGDVSPKSKVLFLSQNRSADVVQEALSTGAAGYVVKSEAASELLPAISAILAGKQFVSARLSGHDLRDVLQVRAIAHRTDINPMRPGHKAANARRHEVGFYSDDLQLLRDVTRFIEAALKVGNAAIIVATRSHQESLLWQLQMHGLDIQAAVEQGRYVAVDVQEALSTFMANGVIDQGRFLEQFGDLIVAAREATSGENPRVSIFGECVHLLWKNGNAEAAIQLEKLGNQLTQIHDIDILCGYSLGNVEVGMDHHVFQRICAEHSAVCSPR